MKKVQKSKLKIAFSNLNLIAKQAEAAAGHCIPRCDQPVRPTAAERKAVYGKRKLSKKSKSQKGKVKTKVSKLETDEAADDDANGYGKNIITLNE